MNKEIREYIDETARKTAREMSLMHAVEEGMNLFKVTEDLLRNYKKLRNLVMNASEEDFQPVGKSKDISVAPPAGSGVRDLTEVRDEFVRERKRSFARTMIQFDEIDRVVQEFSENPYFIIIRMYYFGENAKGEQVASDGERRSIEDITAELEEIGFEYGKNYKTVSRKRVELVRDMTVCLFGKAGSVSNELWKARRNGGGQ